MFNFETKLWVPNMLDNTEVGKACIVALKILTLKIPKLAKIAKKFYIFL